MKPVEPEPESQVAAGPRESEAWGMTPAYDPVETIQRPFAYDFMALIGLILALPLFQHPREAGRISEVTVGGLLATISYLVVMLWLSISVARNNLRSPVIRWVSGVVAFLTSAFLSRSFLNFV